MANLSNNLSFDIISPYFRRNIALQIGSIKYKLENELLEYNQDEIKIAGCRFLIH